MEGTGDHVVTDPRSLLLLDTNILVRLIRDDSVGQRIQADFGLRERSERPLISIITVGEIYALARKLGWGAAKRDQLASLVRHFPVVQLKQQIADKYAEIDYFCEKVSMPARPMGQNDMWIAATASETEASLLTTDSDFDHLNGRFLTVISLDPKSAAPRNAS